MARDGGRTPKTKKATMEAPDKDSKTSKRRANRGFKDLLTSSRKHRRALKKQAPSRFFDGKDHKPGEKAPCATGPNPRRGWLYTAGGALNYH